MPAVVDDEPVARVAQAFGVTRETVYATTRRLAARGVLGLADQKRGRKGPLKVTREIRDFILEARHEAPTLQALVERVATEFSVAVHKKTVERVLAAGGAKKMSMGRRPTLRDETGLSSRRAVRSKTSYPPCCTSSRRSPPRRARVRIPRRGARQGTR